MNNAARYRYTLAAGVMSSLFAIFVIFGGLALLLNLLAPNFFSLKLIIMIASGISLFGSIATVSAVILLDKGHFANVLLGIILHIFPLLLWIVIAPLITGAGYKGYYSMGVQFFLGLIFTCGLFASAGLISGYAASRLWHLGKRSNSIQFDEPPLPPAHF